MSKNKPMRADKRKSVDKVAASLVKNPMQGQVEIAEDTGLGLGTVNRAMDEVEKYGNKDPRIVDLTDEDLTIQELIQEQKLKKLKNNPKEISDSDLNQWDRHSMARLSLFKGDVTDEQGGLKKLSTEEQLLVDKALEDNGF